MNKIVLVLVILLILLSYFKYQSENAENVENMATSPGTMVQLAANDPYSYYLGRYPRDYLTDIYYYPYFGY